MNSTLKERAQKIKLVIFDVDGVLTDDDSSAAVEGVVAASVPSAASTLSTAFSAWLRWPWGWVLAGM